MNNKKLLLKTDRIGFVLSAVLLAALTESTGNAGVSIGIDLAPPVVVVAPPVVVAPVVVVQDDYVYYPDYGVYFNSGRHQYYYLRGDAWVWAPAPDGVTVEVLLASPSVHMDWHDSPANHHKEMLQRYPKNWRPDGENHELKHEVKQDLKQDRKDEVKHDVKQDEKQDEKDMKDVKEDRKDAAHDRDKKPPEQ